MEIKIDANICYSYINKLEKLNNKIFRILHHKSLSTHNIDLRKHYNTLPATHFAFIGLLDIAFCT